MVKVKMPPFRFNDYFEFRLRRYEDDEVEYTYFQDGCRQAIRDLLALNELYGYTFFERLNEVVSLRRDEHKDDNIYNRQWMNGYMTIIDEIEE